MIINPFSAAPVHAKSHARGWSQHWANSLNTTVALKTDDYSSAHELYLDHGANYSGGLNLFGGVTQEVFDNLNNLLKSNAELYSLDIDMPDYVTMLRKRIGQNTCHKDLALIIDQLELRFKDCPTVTQYDLYLKHLAIGDSHATAYAKKDSAVIRTNGQTLYGALKDGKILDLTSEIKKHYESITFVFGAIDVRHHLIRQDNIEHSTMMLLDDYIQLVRKIGYQLDCKIEVAIPPPVEFEGRRIPQTGFYKGTPFFGILDDRKYLTDFILNYLIEEDMNVVHQPIERYEMDPEAYAKEYMELGSSVHIAPIHYRSNSNWGM